MIGLINPVPQPRAELVQSWDGRQVRVRTAGVSHIVEPVSQSEIGLDLPRVAKVRVKAMVVFPPAG